MICAVPICGRPARARGWCQAHYIRWKRRGDLRPDEPIGKPMAGARGPENPRWAGDDVGYAGAHHRVRDRFGPASDRPCTDCGAPAIHWSYDGLDPDELIGYHDHGDGRISENLRYSLRAEHYVPRCHRCHVRFDRGLEDE